MGIYIKVLNADGDVQLAGQVANQQMLDEGYFLYEGEVPNTSKLKYINNTLIADETINKANAVNAAWIQLPEPLKVQYAQHYPAIKAKLEENNPLEAIEYIGYLVPLVPEVYQPLLQLIVDKINEVFEIEGE
jgi:hypothetical protein